MTEELKQLREALRRVKHEAASLADAQVIALEALTAAQPAQAGERDTGPHVLREVFELCDDTMTKMESESTEFSRGRAFEAKGISRAIGTWFQDEFCGRSHMGEPVIQPAAQAAQVPEGFALVPVEPSAEMLQAVIDSGAYHDPDTAKVRAVLRDEYVTMLTAAQQGAE